MYTIEMIQAGHGDCLLIEYGEDDGPVHRILIDGGTAGTYKKVKQRINKLPDNEKFFDLLVITHIDEDHIAGIIKLFEDDNINISFKDIWFNGYNHLSSREELGAKQGEVLTDHLIKQGINWNNFFNKNAAMVRKGANGSFETIMLAGGMELILLSPTAEELINLKPVWKKKAREAGLYPDERHAEIDDENTRRSDRETLGSETMPNVNELAEQESDADNSVSNASSIAFIANYDGHSVLFTGDAYSQVLINNIATYTDGKSLNIDVFKIPHHGSDGNVTKELLNSLNCKTYLVSSNGSRYKHPDQAAIARIIKYGGDNPDIYFNYLSKYNDIWEPQKVQVKYAYTSHYPGNGETGVVIKL